jgi:uncharacterized membrane protein YhiD involved in acid resistance
MHEMQDFLDKTFGLSHVSPRHFAEVLLHLVVAAALGGLVAYRPWRRLIKHSTPPAMETAQAQTLIAVAGALMVAVIGDSMARAFGLVGLGAFIRFRSGIKDPRDAAVMFVMIGVGMACGLGLVPLAVVATVFAALVLAIFDSVRARPARVRLAIEVDQPAQALVLIRTGFRAARVVGAPNGLAEVGKIVIEIDAGRDVDAAVIMEELEKKGVKGVRHVALEED